MPLFFFSERFCEESRILSGVEREILTENIILETLCNQMLPRGGK